MRLLSLGILLSALIVFAVRAQESLEIYAPGGTVIPPEGRLVEWPVLCGNLVDYPGIRYVIHYVYTGPNGESISQYIRAGINLPPNQFYSPNEIGVPPTAPPGAYSVLATLWRVTEGWPYYVERDSDYQLWVKQGPIQHEEGNGGNIPTFIPGFFGNNSESQDFYPYDFGRSSNQGNWDTVFAAPEEYDLNPAYPNPFNPSTTVTVSLPKVADLTVTVYNNTGQQIATLAEGIINAGKHNLTFDASGLPSGVYFIHATVPGHMDDVQKVILVK